MRRLGIHKNILFLTIKWRLAFEFVSLALTWKWTNSSQSMHRRWASSLRPKACLYWSWNQGLSLLRTWVTLVGTKLPTSSNKCSFKTSTGLSASQMLWKGRSIIAPQTVFQLTCCFTNTFLLTQRFGTAWAIEMTATERSDLSYTYRCMRKKRPVLGQEHQ